MELRNREREGEREDGEKSSGKQQTISADVNKST